MDVCGSVATQGNATCLVHATGDATFLGKIAQGPLRFLQLLSGVLMCCTGSGIKSSRVKSTLEIQIEHFAEG